MPLHPLDDVVLSIASTWPHSDCAASVGAGLVCELVKSGGPSLFKRGDMAPDGGLGGLSARSAFRATRGGPRSVRRRAMTQSIQRVVQKRTGTVLRIGAFPWALLTLPRQFVPTFRETREMRYLWRQPIRMDNTRLVQVLGHEPHTPLDDAVEATLKPALGVIPAQAARVTSRGPWPRDYDAELEQQNGSTTGDNNWSPGSLRVPPPGLAQAAIDATNRMTIALYSGFMVHVHSIVGDRDRSRIKAACAFRVSRLRQTAPPGFPLERLDDGCSQPSLDRRWRVRLS